MTHLPYVAGAYAIALGAALALSMSAVSRLRRAQRRLDAARTQDRA